MSYLVEDSTSLVAEELQLSLLNDYKSWKLSQESTLIELNNLDYFINQIKSDFKKLSIVDNSLSLENHENKIISYFKLKIANEIKNNVKGYEFYDLFCGAGGLSVGLEKSNLTPILALDKDKSSLLTYHFNRPYLKNNQIINDDIREVSKDFEFGKVPLIVGGPPCQGFSNANKQRKENDERNQLYKFYIHSVDIVKPDVFLMENVEGILEYIEDINKDFNKINYTLYPYIFNTKDFGFPQNRKRVFIFGVHNKYQQISSSLNTIFNQTICEYKGKNRFSLWDAIRDLPSLEAKTARNSTYVESKNWGYTYGPFKKTNTPYTNFLNEDNSLNTPILNHKSKYNNERDIEIYRLLKPGEKSDAESIAEINPYLNRDDIFKDKFFKLRPDEVCKTITAHMYFDCHMYIHPFSARGLTPREAARIQGFEDDYLFLGSPNEWYRQIGNAVSPLLSKIVGKALNNVLDRIYEV